MRNTLKAIWIVLQIVWLVTVVLLQGIRDKVASKIGRFWTYMIFAIITWLPLSLMPMHHAWQLVTWVIMFLLWVYFVSLGARWASMAGFEKRMEEAVQKAINNILKHAGSDSEADS